MRSPIVVSDLDGTLTTAEAWRGVLAWVAEHHTSPAARRFVRVRMPKVVLAKAGILDKEAFRAGWFRDLAGLLAGLPAQRMLEMGEWVAGEFLWPARRQGSLDLVAAAVADARQVDPAARLVVATGAYQAIADGWARRMGADIALGTPLEVVDGALTGRVSAPVQTGEQKAAAVRELAAGAPILAAFGDTGADVPFLRLARRPVAVAPDRVLRREAVRTGWEIFEAT